MSSPDDHAPTRSADEFMDETAAKAESRPPCWRSECRSGCYYPTACSEVKP